MGTPRGRTTIPGRSLSSRSPGGGARAAAFSYGVLEELRRTELTAPGGKRRMLDEADLITEISVGAAMR